MLKKKTLYCLIFLMFPAVSAMGGEVRPALPFSIAFNYHGSPPINELQAFDIAVIDPDARGIDPRASRKAGCDLFAYVSVGEADPNRSFYADIKPEWLIGDNPAWKSRLVNLADPNWRRFFLDHVVEPLWASGYRGFFLDTLDSFLLVKDTKRHAELQAGLVQTIRSIRQKHPEARLILNRGFEILEQVKDVAFAVAAESLFRTFDPATGIYGQVKESDRLWLLAKFEEVRKAGLPAISIDYVAPKDRDLARETASRISALGFIPWVTDKDLSTVGVGTVDVLPRTVLGLYDGSEAPDPSYTNLHRFAVMPLNYLGYQVVLHDMREPLPQECLKGRYAGVIVWPNSESSGVKQNLLTWALRQQKDGVPLIFLDRFGVSIKPFLKAMGGRLTPPKPKAGPMTILKKDSIMGFETMVMPPKKYMPVLRFDSSRPLLTLAGQGFQSDPVAITPWGGYALYPYVINELVDKKACWVINPFEFFRQALRLPACPAPDVTTENGVRLLMVHIDADGFESRVENAARPLAVTELRERILMKYKLPTTYSVITSTLGHLGNPTPETAVYQNEARLVFKLPWIEAGSHTYSHPFYWEQNELTRKEYKEQYLPIPGYLFNRETEIAGSIRFIEENLLPPGRKVKLLQWTGNCLPDVKALGLCYQIGVGNINGGDTLIKETNPFVTDVAPLGIYRNGLFQVYAPNQNENVYTNNWTGPFYGYSRVIETFRLTDSPRRLKPVNIYYHTYSATKEASRKALEDVYDWAVAQNLHAVYTSEYVEKVLDFNRTVIARFEDGWLIRNHGQLRQVRIPANAGYPDLDRSRNVIGFSDHLDQRYIHLGPGGDAVLKLKDTPPDRPFLSAVAARIVTHQWTEKGLKLTLQAHRETEMVFQNADSCRLLIKGRQSPIKRVNGSFSYSLSAGSHELDLECPNKIREP